MNLAIVHPQDPDIALRGDARLEKREELPIAGPRCQILNAITRSQTFQTAAAVGKLPEQVARALCIRTKRNVLTVRGPAGALVRASLKGEPRQRVPGQIVEPDLVVKLDRDAPAIWGEPGIAVRQRRRRQRLLHAVPSHPHQLPLNCPGASRDVHERACGGNAILRSTACSLEHVFHNGNRRPGELQALSIEWHGHQRSGLDVYQVPGPRVTCVGPLNQVSPIPRLH